MDVREYGGRKSYNRRHDPDEDSRDSGQGLGGDVTTDGVDDSAVPLGTEGGQREH